jgi:hypothetical protein
MDGGINGKEVGSQEEAEGIGEEEGRHSQASSGGQEDGLDTQDAQGCAEGHDDEKAWEVGEEARAPGGCQTSAASRSGPCPGRSRASARRIRAECAAAAVSWSGAKRSRADMN